MLIRQRRVGLTTVLLALIALLAIIASTITSAHAAPANNEKLEALQAPTTIGEGVTIAYDGNKTFNIRGNGEIDKVKFNCTDRGSGCGKGYYLNKLRPAVGDDIGDYTIKVNDGVTFPKDSDSLFFDVDTKIDIYPTIDISNVTDISHMFQDADNANPNVSQWDTSNVTNMGATFALTKVANPDVSSWDVSKVTSFTTISVCALPNALNTGNTQGCGMFRGAQAANPDVSQWVTSSARHMDHMFANTLVANPEVKNWDVSNVQTLSGIFLNAKAAQPDISKWHIEAKPVPTNYILGFRFGEAFYGLNSPVLDVSNIDVSGASSGHYESIASLPAYGAQGDLLERFVFTDQDFAFYEVVDSLDVHVNGLHEYGGHHPSVPARELFSVYSYSTFVINHITDYDAYLNDPTSGKERVETFKGYKIPKDYSKFFVKNERYELCRVTTNNDCGITASTTPAPTDPSHTPAPTTPPTVGSSLPLIPTALLITAIGVFIPTLLSVLSPVHTIPTPHTGTTPTAQQREKEHTAQPNAHKRTTLAVTGPADLVLLLGLAILFIAAGIFLTRRRSTN